MILQLLVLAATVAAAPDPWSLLAQRDLEAMRAQILAHHPGPVDPLNPGFRKWLDEGFEASMAKAREARTFGGYVQALRHYGAGFHDGHLNSGVTVTQTEVSWPGFVVRLRGDRYLVVAVADAEDASLPPVGSEIVDCDGRTPRTMVEEDLWPYAMGSKIESRWPAVASGLLIDIGNPWTKQPKQCRFRIGATIETRALRYRTTSQNEINRVAATIAAPRAPEPPARPTGAKGVWVSIPSFGGGNETTRNNLEEQIAKAPQWRGAELIVFDVRGNGGGNSTWGRQILDALYGKEYLDRTIRRRFARQYVEWRVSQDNLAHVRGIVESIRRGQGTDAPAAKAFEEVAGGMEQALARGDALFRQSGHPPGDPDPKPAPEPLYKGRVVLLTDPVCASACLDFADEVLLLPSATHAGRTTSADSVYMEVRPVDLPSGIGRVSLPVKVYRERPRGHNEPYVPEVPYSGDIDDTAAVETWIHTAVVPRKAAEEGLTRYWSGNDADVRPRLHGPLLLLAGGGGDVTAGLQTAIDRLRGEGVIDVVVLRASGADGYNPYFMGMRGVDSVLTMVITDRAAAARPEVVQAVREAELVYFAGGDQCNYIRWIKGTPVEPAVEEVYGRGGAVGGTSAGLAIMGEYVYDACPSQSAKSAEVLLDPFHADVSVSTGFFEWSALRGVITDTHFSQRDRLGRLLVFMARSKARHGLGVSEGTIAVVDRNGKGVVYGKGPVHVITGSRKPERVERQQPLTWRGLKVLRFESGQTFDLRRIGGGKELDVVEGRLSAHPY